MRTKNKVKKGNKGKKVKKVKRGKRGRMKRVRRKGGRRSTKIIWNPFNRRIKK